eukprot:gnl/Chilomastix_cuspidata/5693.p1 GENE.gnl/Chilomastix_cuspidata/5693~~gnl/Chilomastix_cuspidata/5693.p1  ORF type:complete len:668 (-),score=46.42 gnl/Chilomastix_cuspidata/5693:629-2632(-)
MGDYGPAHDSTSPEEYTTLLRDHLTKCEEEGRYFEAECARKRLEEIKVQVQKSRKSELKSHQKTEESILIQAHQSEVERFEFVWAQRLNEFCSRSSELEAEMLLRHETDMREFLETQRRGLARPRFSGRLLNMRKIERTLARQGDYRRAQEMQQQNDALEQRELARLSERNEQSVAKKAAHLRRQQALELSVFRKRVASARQQLVQGRLTDLQNLERRFTNAKRELQMQHRLERQKIKKYLHVVGPQASQPPSRAVESIVAKYIQRDAPTSEDLTPPAQCLSPSLSPNVFAPPRFSHGGNLPSEPSMDSSLLDVLHGPSPTRPHTTEHYALAALPSPKQRRARRRTSAHRNTLIAAKGIYTPRAPKARRRVRTAPKSAPNPYLAPQPSLNPQRASALRAHQRARRPAGRSKKPRVQPVSPSQPVETLSEADTTSKHTAEYVQASLRVRAEQDNIEALLSAPYPGADTQVEPRSVPVFTPLSGEAGAEPAGPLRRPPLPMCRPQLARSSPTAPPGDTAQAQECDVHATPGQGTPVGDLCMTESASSGTLCADADEGTPPLGGCEGADENQAATEGDPTESFNDAPTETWPDVATDDEDALPMPKEVHAVFPGPFEPVGNEALGENETPPTGTHPNGPAQTPSEPDAPGVFGFSGSGLGAGEEYNDDFE